MLERKKRYTEPAGKTEWSDGGQSQYKTKQAQGHRLAVEGSELTAASHPLTANCGCKIERVGNNTAAYPEGAISDLGSVLWGDTSRECAEIMEKLHRQSDAGDAPFNSTNVFLS